MGEAELARQIERLDDSLEAQRMHCGKEFTRINDRFEEGAKTMAAQGESIRNIWASQTNALTEIKVTMKEFRAEVKEQIACLRTEVNSSIAEVKADVAGVRADVCNLQTTVNNIKAEGAGKNKLASGVRNWVPVLYGLITTGLAIYYYFQSIKGGN